MKDNHVETQIGEIRGIETMLHLGFLNFSDFREKVWICDDFLGFFDGD